MNTDAFSHKNTSKALWFGLFPADEHYQNFLHDIAVLECPVDYPHVTFGYKVDVPADIDWDAVYDVEVIGYGCDGDNEGYAISFPAELDNFYFGADVPHLTLSTSEDGAPVNTAFIDFDEVTEPYVIPMKFGYYSRGKYFV